MTMRMIFVGLVLFYIIMFSGRCKPVAHDAEL